MTLFLAYMVQSVFWTACGNLLMAVDRHHAYSRVLIVSSVAAVVLAWIGGRQFGLLGVVAGVLAADLVIPFWFVPYLLGRYWREFSPGFFVRELVPVAAATGAAMFAGWTAVLAIAAMGFWWFSGLRKR
jgi:O-antigen/teichoic acid export membrane protein